MVDRQLVYRILDEPADGELKLLGAFLNLLLEVPRDGADKRDRPCPFVKQDVPLEELPEAVLQKFLDLRNFPLLIYIWCQACQETVGLRLPVYFLQQVG